MVNERTGFSLPRGRGFVSFSKKAPPFSRSFVAFLPAGRNLNKKYTFSPLHPRALKLIIPTRAGNHFLSCPYVNPKDGILPDRQPIRCRNRFFESYEGVKIYEKKA